MAIMSSSLLLFVLLVLSSSSSCYSSSFQENSLLHSYVDDANREATGFAHPSYMSILENPKFSESNNLRTRLFSTSASVKKVSVDDFGAKGNGAADDTQVRACSN